MLVLTYNRSYRKAGQPVFVFSVASSLSDPKAAQTELAEFEQVQGNFLRKDEQSGAPLFFSSTFIESGTELAKRRDGSGFFPLVDLAEQSRQIEEVATTMQGKLEGIRRYAGMSRKGFAQMAMQSVLG